jgi:uncharacterized glyoxalase superfamily protein PhnB
MSPQITPYLYYADADAAVDFMIKAFGLALESAFRTPEGKIVHAQLSIGTGRIFVGPGMAYFGTHGVENPDAVHAALYVYVDGLEAHLERSRACGAKIRAEISDKGADRIYAASDPEGQRWIFAQRK